MCDFCVLLCYNNHMTVANFLTSKIKTGFTLAEVLITLVIIGVVAALTIPTAVNKYREQQTIQSLKTTYSALSQAIKMAEAAHGPVETWDIAPGDNAVGALKLYNYIAPNLSKVQECQLNQGCFADEYLNLQGEVSSLQPKIWPVYARGRMNNGVSFLLWSSGDCENGFYAGFCGSIGVDLNGEKKPNRFGYDYFTFRITKNGLVPRGLDKDDMATYCKYSGTNRENGFACTAWVLYKNNFDYKKKNVSW